MQWATKRSLHIRGTTAPCSKPFRSYVVFGCGVFAYIWEQTNGGVVVPLKRFQWRALIRAMFCLLAPGLMEGLQTVFHGSRGRRPCFNMTEGFMERRTVRFWFSQEHNSSIAEFSHVSSGLHSTDPVWTRLFCYYSWPPKLLRFAEAEVRNIYTTQPTGPLVVANSFQKLKAAGSE